MRVMGYELTDSQLLNMATTEGRFRGGGVEGRSEHVGIVRGYNYTFWPDTIRLLKRNGRVDEALALLLECIEAAERDGPLAGGQIAPWYTEAAAIVYRQQKEYAAEIAVLERFEKASPRRYRGAFRARIAKASVLRAAKG